ncbi:hypothetical protein Tco_0993253 [Tanacetum coccineum]|uniref:Uncharacterized protein n=1 Tax=Tanacetum coccineum TaxID=301880 RepID=A0ABQ5F4Y5_9ASTR
MAPEVLRDEASNESRSYQFINLISNFHHEPLALEVSRIAWEPMNSSKSIRCVYRFPIHSTLYYWDTCSGENSGGRYENQGVAALEQEASCIAEKAVIVADMEERVNRAVIPANHTARNCGEVGKIALSERNGLKGFCSSLHTLSCRLGFDWSLSNYDR